MARMLATAGCGCLAIAATLASCTRAAPPPRPALAEIQANDNRVPSGVGRDGTLTLQLEIGEGQWRPELARPAYQILAFGEPGKPLVTPGPTIRVRAGTRIDVTVRNQFNEDIVVHGLDDRSTPAAALRVPAHGTASTTFATGAAGTYYYWGGRGNTLASRTAIDSQLMGALIVDPRDGAGVDRIFVIGHRNDQPGITAWVINGRSWPDTERLTYQVGQPVRWRWINATDARHPMHLHGHYFRVTRVGDNAIDQPVKNRASQVVTEMMPRGQTMDMEWSPERAGDWLFHCHIVMHVMPENRVLLEQWFDDYATLPHEQHMSGLVLGIHAEAAPAATRPEPAGARRLTLVAGERPGVQYEVPGLKRSGVGYGLGDGAITAPGPTLILTRSQPVEITVVNRLAYSTSVHWHGIELESYHDGVPHFGGDARRRTPPIMPGGTFVARFTPPRAGTFMYHTHFNDYVQMSTGLYGALIVVEPGRPFDPAVDHVFLISRDGLDDEKDPVLLNGAVNPPASTLRTGVTHRLRIINITPIAIARVRLLRGDQPVIWRAVAKDGVAVPTDATGPQPADFMFSPGEIYDFEFDAKEAGELRLEVVLDHETHIEASTRLILRPAK